MDTTRLVAERCRGAMFCTIALFGTTFSSAAAGIEYRKDLPMLITYQNDYGNWNGCGPVQCTVSNWDSEDRVVDLVTHDKHGRFRHIGSVGRCHVYQSSGELESYDNQPDEVAGMAGDKC